MIDQSHSWPSSNITGTNTFWTIDFMGRNRQQVNIHLVNINRNLTIRLSSISVEKHFIFTTYFTNFFQRLDDTNFITAIIETNTVSFLIAFFKSSKLINPSELTGKYVTSNPSSCICLALSKTHLCSV